MRIANAMFAKGKGGIEQAFVDYSNALSRSGRHTVISYLHPDAAISVQLEGLPTAMVEVSNFGQFDPFAVKRIAKQLERDATEIVITHGNRAAELMRKAAKIAGPKLGRTIPVVGLAHNYKTKHILKLNAIFAITHDLAGKVIGQGMVKESVFIIPNMMFTPDDVKVADPLIFRSPPVIGTMGRFVKKKGFAEFLQALALLKARGVAFHAIIGGNGDEHAALHEKATELDLLSDVTFAGWVQDKKAFFESIDIFVLPSLHEPFGIVLLEAFAYGKPVVTTDAEGPLEIASDGMNALIVKRADDAGMAQALSELIHDPKRAEALAIYGLETVNNTYAAAQVTTQIEQALSTILAKHTA